MLLPSVRREEHPAYKKLSDGVDLSGARCRLFAYGPADATAVPKPRHLLPHLHPDWFTFLIPAYLGCPGKEAVNQV